MLLLVVVVLHTNGRVSVFCYEPEDQNPGFVTADTTVVLHKTMPESSRESAEPLFVAYQPTGRTNKIFSEGNFTDFVSVEQRIPQPRDVRQASNAKNS
jgi:hypothetical protein